MMNKKLVHNAVWQGKLICEVTYEDVNLCMADGSEITALNGDVFADLEDCCISGDVEPACRYFSETYDIDWRTVRKVSDDPIKFENLPATEAEITASAESIYFESDSDFTDQDLAKCYLIRQAAADIVENSQQ